MLKWSEASVQQALARAFEWWRHICVPNVCEGSEQDFVLLTRAGLLWECEVKISLSDWKADLGKDRQYRTGWEPARFYYAVPEALCAQKEDIPRWCPAHAGVLVLYDRDEGGPWVRFVRQARPLHRRKVTPDVERELLRKAYFRYWRHVAPVRAADDKPWLD